MLHVLEQYASFNNCFHFILIKLECLSTTKYIT